MIDAQTGLAGHLVIWFLVPWLTVGMPAIILLLRRIFARLEHVYVDFVGQPARPGVDRRPGVMERLQTLEKMGRQVADVHHELTENGGGSVKDQVGHINAIVSGDPTSH